MTAESDCPDDRADDDESRLGWWTISGVALFEALKQVEDGQPAGDVFDRIYMESTHHDVPGTN